MNRPHRDSGIGASAAESTNQIKQLTRTWRIGLIEPKKQLNSSFAIKDSSKKNLLLVRCSEGNQRPLSYWMFYFSDENETIYAVGKG